MFEVGQKLAIRRTAKASNHQSSLLRRLVSSREFQPARRPRSCEFFFQVEYRVAVFNERPRAKDVRVLKRA